MSPFLFFLAQDTAGKRRRADEASGAKRGGKDGRPGADGGGRTGSIFAVGAGVAGMGGPYEGRGDDAGGGKYAKTAGAGSLRNMSKKTAMLKTNELLEQNYKVIQDIRMNLSNFRTDENVDMFSLFRSNLNELVAIIGHAAIMRQMPPIPVQLNAHLADVIVGAAHVAGMPPPGMMPPMPPHAGAGGAEKKMNGGGAAPPAQQMMMGYPPDAGQPHGQEAAGPHAQGYFNSNVVSGGFSSH